MSEGDATRRLASTMNELFTSGSVLASFPQGRFAASAEKINGRILERIRIHGRHMLIGFVPPETVGSEPQEWMHTYLGLYGWWCFDDDESVVDEDYGVAHRITSVAKGEWDEYSETRWGKSYSRAARGE